MVLKFSELVDRIAVSFVAKIIDVPYQFEDCPYVGTNM